MSLRLRLVLTYAAFSGLLAAPALYGVHRLSALREIAVEQRAHHAAAYEALGGLQTALARLDRFQRSYIADPAPEHLRGLREELQQLQRHLLGLRNAGYRQAARDAEAGVRRLEAAADQVQRLIEEERYEEAAGFYEEVKPLFDEARASLAAIGREVDQRSLSGLEAAQGISAAAARTTLAALAGTLALALALAFWTSASLISPLHRLRRAMAAVAAGKFEASADLPYERRDEVGDLSRSFRFMTERLGELERMRAEFVSITSHDLKTPINVIGGYAELIGDGLYGEVSDRQREVLVSVQEQTQVLTRLVNQLLDISRIEAGGLRIEVREVATAEFFASVERAFRALADLKQVAFAVEYGESLPATLALDADRMRDQVLGNLLSNAFKFTGPGGSIVVRAWARAETLAIDVSDTGPGIPRAQLQRVFEKYFQVGAEARTQGSGLGLAIAKEVVEAHGGRIAAESEPGQGTTIQIRLPLAAPATRARSALRVFSRRARGRPA